MTLVVGRVDPFQPGEATGEPTGNKCMFDVPGVGSWAIVANTRPEIQKVENFVHIHVFFQYVSLMLFWRKGKTEKKQSLPIEKAKYYL